MPIDFKFKVKSVWCQIPDGHLLFTGGDLPTSKEVWDISEEFLYVKRRDMISSRCEHGLAMHEGRVYAISGQQTEDNRTPHCEVFDPNKNEWTALSPIPNPTAQFTPVVLETKTLYVIGGSESTHLVQIYSIEDDTWSVVSIKHPVTLVGKMPCFKTHGIETTFVMFVQGMHLYKFDPVSAGISLEEVLEKEVECDCGPCVLVGDTLFCASTTAQVVYTRIKKS
jgi:N-acetylneuraminic acid mutarotase